MWKEKVVFGKTKMNALEKFHKGELMIRCEGVIYKILVGNCKSLKEFCSWIVL